MDWSVASSILARHGRPAETDLGHFENGDEDDDDGEDQDQDDEEEVGDQDQLDWVGMMRCHENLTMGFRTPKN